MTTRPRPGFCWTREGTALLSVELFVVDRSIGALAFMPVFLASLLGAAKAGPVFGRMTLGFGALAIFPEFVEIDDHGLCQFRVCGFILGSHALAQEFAG